MADVEMNQIVYLPQASLELVAPASATEHQPAWQEDELAAPASNGTATSNLSGATRREAIEMLFERQRRLAAADTSEALASVEQQQQQQQRYGEYYDDNYDEASTEYEHGGEQHLPAPPLQQEASSWQDEQQLLLDEQQYAEQQVMFNQWSISCCCTGRLHCCFSCTLLSMQENEARMTNSSRRAREKVVFSTAKATTAVASVFTDANTIVTYCSTVLTPVYVDVNLPYSNCLLLTCMHALRRR
jgi:hypothetical protein